MNLKEFKKLLEDKISENGYNDKEHSIPVYDLRNKVRNLIEEILSEIPDTEFEVYVGSAWNGLSENKLYITPKYQCYSERRNYMCEIQLHKTLDYVNYRNIGQWFIKEITVKAPDKNITFEEVYRLHKEETEKRIAEYEERRRKEEEEREAQLERNRIHAEEQAQLVMQYIKDNNLDKEEFIKYARIFSTYPREVEAQ